KHPRITNAFRLLTLLSCNAVPASVGAALFLRLSRTLGADLERLRATDPSSRARADMRKISALARSSAGTHATRGYPLSLAPCRPKGVTASTPVLPSARPP